MKDKIKYITTDSLDAMIGDDYIKVAVFNKKNETYTYDHDEVYSTHQEKFETMNCFQEYGSYTNSNTVPKFCRDLSEVEKPEIAE